LGNGSPVGFPRLARKTFTAQNASVGEARAYVTDWLRASAAEELMIGDAAVAISEACTNVVVHAYRGLPGNGNGHGPVFSVVAERSGEAFTVTVADSGCGMTPRPDSPGIGLGVPLMATLSDNVEVGTDADGAGTVVVMTFTAAGAHSRL
jgi:anti-sigma regulatory factor (Ser/Thr protein kinase)